MSDVFPKCLPPEGTPEGTKCVLTWHRHSRMGRGPGFKQTWNWRGGQWRRPFFGSHDPKEMAALGWTFQSIEGDTP